MTRKSPSSVGFYIHIPFCHARCGYCDFVTFTRHEDKIDQYIDDLCKEIALYASSPFNGEDGGEGWCAVNEAAKPFLIPTFPLTTAGPQRYRKLRKLQVSLEGRRGPIATVFFGGGTPSVLEPTHLRKIFSAIHKHFHVISDAEITLEANPESITPDKARAWKEVGINRLSIGLQVFDNALLKKIDRLHTVEEFLAAYHTVHEVGFDNVSIDLIYGFDGQTLEAWQDTVKSTAALNPEHLSLYALKIEEHTPFAAMGLKVNDDLEAEMYEWARRYLSGQGYEQYEISNFARPGKACRHNLIYWRQEDYLGVGVGAVGCVGEQRWVNHKNLHDYHKDIEAGKLPRISIENLDLKTRQFERLMLGLRLREGIVWGEDTNPDWIASRSTLHAKGLLEEVHAGRWRIADSAVALTNQILLPFIG